MYASNDWMCPTNLIPLTRYIATRFRSFLIALRKSPCIPGWFCAISVLSLRFDGIKRIRSCPSCKPRKRKMAQMWVDSLNGMVGRNDLRLLTLLPWKPYLGRFSRLTGEGRQWCPLCLEEDLQSRTPVYERLIWSMRWVGHCPRHRCRLAERCPECDYQQAGELSPLQSCGFCSRCQGWLGTEHPDPVFDRQTADGDYEVWAAQSLADLVAHPPASTLPRTGNPASRVIDRGIARFFDGNAAAFCEHIGISKTCPTYWRCAGAPNAAVLMAISYCLQISVRDLLTGKDVFSGSCLPPLPPILLRTNLRPVARRRNWNDVRQFLTEVANGTRYYGSLTSAAESIHLSPSQAYARFADLCRQIAEALRETRREVVRTAREQRKDRLDKAIRIEAARMISTGQYPSVDRLITYAKQHGLGADKPADRSCIRHAQLGALAGAPGSGRRRRNNAAPDG
ncbi:hypothetical protein AWB70_07221 [Caballeronia cordobensis]|uniref:TniQ domain-containing protein n=1 Tax=Caballeronia cordobensis TaxID=1353886 RepID=A0A158JQL5_CABCO|nr:hypothetical protein AWB70_07221 [Caballeronia cordobensis]